MVPAVESGPMTPSTREQERALRRWSRLEGCIQGAARLEWPRVSQLDALAAEVRR